MIRTIELIASYWTIAGDVYPFAPNEISPFPFEKRVEVAARAGYRGLGLLHADLMAVSNRLGYSEMRRILDANGIYHVELEFLSDWYAQGRARAESDMVRKDLLEAAEALSARCIKIAPSIDEPSIDDVALDMPRMIESFAALSREAAKYGTSIALEIMPFSNIRTLSAALELVSTDPQPNGGLYLDIWHMARGGIDYSEVAKIPQQFIKAVELDDADRDVVGTLWDDTRFHRRLCGEGALDIPAFLKATREAGYRGPYAVEIISQEHRRLSLEEEARRSFETTVAQFRNLD
ncbi:MAG TPA: sugar phosphate isomerase/epimerase [Ktedonobacteraceae bacterium]|nr:sugar phosphate isomerase/epimerase [Ktedonobacteraceae bacterium]